MPRAKVTMDKATRERLQERFTELASYLVTSARGLLDEPPEYGPFRLIQATHHVVKLLAEEGLSSEILDSVGRRIADVESSAMGQDPDDLRVVLDELVLALLAGIDEFNT
jgi:hypothetical protein